MMLSAVPAPAVARAPALQWVSTAEPGVMSAAPSSPISLQDSTSWRKMLSACSRSTSTTEAGGRASERSSAERMRSSAVKRFTAVGRVEARRSIAARMEGRNFGTGPRPDCIAARTTAYAAATPMAGAPRIRRARIASATIVMVGGLNVPLFMRKQGLIEEPESTVGPANGLDVHGGSVFVEP